jgi:hypothetical protein
MGRVLGVLWLRVPLDLCTSFCLRGYYSVYGWLLGLGGHLCSSLMLSLRSRALLSMHMLLRDGFEGKLCLISMSTLNHLIVSLIMQQGMGNSLIILARRVLLSLEVLLGSNHQDLMPLLSAVCMPFYFFIAGRVHDIDLVGCIGDWVMQGFLMH